VIRTVSLHVHKYAYHTCVCTSLHAHIPADAFHKAQAWRRPAGTCRPQHVQVFTANLHHQHGGPEAPHQAANEAALHTCPMWVKRSKRAGPCLQEEAGTDVLVQGELLVVVGVIPLCACARVCVTAGVAAQESWCQVLWVQGVGLQNTG
jgi:hypothetical protein